MAIKRFLQLTKKSIKVTMSLLGKQKNKKLGDTKKVKVARKNQVKNSVDLPPHIIVERKNIEDMLQILFSPKQTELFLKKSQGLPFTKTEKEYFSRIIKKKVSVLADENIHRLAQKIQAKL